MFKVLFVVSFSIFTRNHIDCSPPNIISTNTTLFTFTTDASGPHFSAASSPSLTYTSSAWRGRWQCQHMQLRWPKGYRDVASQVSICATVSCVIDTVLLWVDTLSSDKRSNDKPRCFPSIAKAITYDLKKVGCCLRRTLSMMSLAPGSGYTVYIVCRVISYPRQVCVSSKKALFQVRTIGGPMILELWLRYLMATLGMCKIL